MRALSFGRAGVACVTCVALASGVSIAAGAGCASFDAADSTNADGAAPTDADADADAAASRPDGEAGAADGAPTLEAGTSSYAAAVVADGPLAYWRLGEPAGSAVVHSLVGASDADLLGGPMLGRPGALLGDLDTSIGCGAAQVISAREKFDFEGNKPFTLEAWVEPTVFDDTFRVLINDQGSGASGRESYGVYVRKPTGGMIEMVFERYVGNDQRSAVVYAPAVAAGVWQHVAATYDGSTLTLYVDGIALGSAPDTRPQAAKTSSQPLYIGGGNPTDYSLVGSIDEVAIYGKALPAAAVAAHHKIGATGAP